MRIIDGAKQGSVNYPPSPFPKSNQTIIESSIKKASISSVEKTAPDLLRRRIQRMLPYLMWHRKSEKLGEVRFEIWYHIAASFSPFLAIQTRERPIILPY